MVEGHVEEQRRKCQSTQHTRGGTDECACKVRLTASTTMGSAGLRGGDECGAWMARSAPAARQTFAPAPRCGLRCDRVLLNDLHECCMPRAGITQYTHHGGQA